MLDSIYLNLATAPGGDLPQAPGGDTGTPAGGGGGQSLQPATTQPGGGPKGSPGGCGDPNMMLLMVGMLVVLFFLMILPQRREKKKRAAMLATLAKGSRILTIGGIIGTVVEVREDRVVVRVDENKDTRMSFARSAIQTVLADKQDIDKTELPVQK